MAPETELEARGLDSGLQDLDAILDCARYLFPRFCLKVDPVGNSGVLSGLREGLDAALAAGMSDAQAWARRGRVLRFLGDPAAAADFDRAVAADAGSARAWLWRGEFRLWRDPGDEAGRADLARAAELAPRSGRPFLIRAAAALLGRRRVGAEFSYDSAAADLDRALELEPADFLARLIRGRLRAEAGLFAGAKEDLDAAAACEPALPAAFYLRAGVQLEVGDRAGALEDLERALFLDPDAKGGLHALVPGLGAYSGDREGIRRLETFLAAEPDAAWAYVLLGEIKRHPDLGDFPGAVGDLEAACRLAPRRAWMRGFLARARSTSGDPAGGLAELDRALADAPACAWLHAWKGEALRKAGRLDEALACFDRALALNPGYGWTYSWRGGLLRQAGRFAEAVRDLDIGIYYNPDYPWAFCERASARRALGAHGDALQDLARAHRADAKFAWDPAASPALVAPDPKLAAAVRAWEGHGRIRRGELEAAVADLTAAVAADPSLAWAYAWRGEAQLKLDRLESGLRDLERAAALDPAYAPAQAWLGAAHQRSGRAEAAEAALGRAIALDPKSAWAWGWRGEIRLGLGRLAEAAADLDHALRMDPHNASWALRRGEARRRLGRDPLAALAPSLGALAAELGVDGEQENLQCLVRFSRPERTRYRELLEALEDPGACGRLAPEDRRALKGKVLAELGRLEEAEALLRRRPASRLLPAPAWLGQVLLLQGDFAGSLACFDRASRDFPEYPWTCFLRAAARLALGDVPGAEADLGPFLESGAGRAAAAALSALVASAAGRTAQARARARDLGGLCPDRAWPLVLRALVCRADADLFGVRDALSEAIRREPAPELYAERAKVWESLGDLPHALADAGEALRRRPCVSHHALKAHLHGCWREYEAAGRHYGAALRLQPGRADLRRERGRMFSAMGRLDLARRDFEAVAAANNSDLSSRCELSQLKGLTGNPRAAEVELSRWMREPGARAQALYARGYLRLLDRRAEAAARDFTACAGAAGPEPLRDKALFYRTLARAQPGRSSGADGPLPEVLLIGLGICPPLSATVESLRLMARCDVLFNNVTGAEVFEMLRLYCRDVRPLAYHQNGDEPELAATVLAQARPGRTVAFVTRGHPLFYGPLAEELLRLCRNRGLSWRCLNSLSSFDDIYARFGGGSYGRPGALILDGNRAAREPGVLNPELPTLLYLTGRMDGKQFEVLCRGLAAAYGVDGRCTVFDHRVDQRPIPYAVGQLATLTGTMIGSGLFFFDGRSATGPAAAAKSFRTAADAGRLWLLGLGPGGRGHATLQSLQALGSCDAIYGLGLGPDDGAGLARFGRPVLPIDGTDADAAADWEERMHADLRRGRTVALVAPEHPGFRGPLAGRLIERCGRSGIPWQSLGALAPAGAAIAATGLMVGPRVGGLQALELGALRDGGLRFDPSLPLVLYGTGDPGAGGAAAAWARLRAGYPPDHPAAWCSADGTVEWTAVGALPVAGAPWLQGRVLTLPARTRSLRRGGAGLRRRLQAARPEASQ